MQVWALLWTEKDWPTASNIVAALIRAELASTVLRPASSDDDSGEHVIVADLSESALGVVRYIAGFALRSVALHCVLIVFCLCFEQQLGVRLFKSFLH